MSLNYKYVKVKTEEILNRDRGFSKRYKDWLLKNKETIFTALESIKINDSNKIYYILKEDYDNHWLFEEDDLEKVGEDKFIYIINGSPSSGKDTFVNFVSDFVKTKNYSSIDCIKNIASIVGWDGKKTNRDRKFLSDLKQLLVKYNDYPCKESIASVNKFLHNYNEKFMFIHVRESEEIEKLKNSIKNELNFNNVKTILVKRYTGFVEIGNVSDDNVENYNYDIIIDNYGTLTDLKNKAKDFVVKAYKGEC